MKFLGHVVFPQGDKDAIDDRGRRCEVEVHLYEGADISVIFPWREWHARARTYADLWLAYLPRPPNFDPRRRVDR